MTVQQLTETKRLRRVCYDISREGVIRVVTSRGTLPFLTGRVQVSDVSRSGAGLIVRVTAQSTSDDMGKLFNRRRTCQISFELDNPGSASRLPGKIVSIEPKHSSKGLSLSLAVSLDESDPVVMAWWSEFSRHQS